MSGKVLGVLGCRFSGSSSSRSPGRMKSGRRSRLLQDCHKVGVGLIEGKPMFFQRIV